MSTTFISHRMFVAALNQDRPAPAPSASPRTSMDADRSTPMRSSNQLTVEQLAAFAARYWPEFSFGNHVESSAS